MNRVLPFHRLLAASGASNLADGALLTVMPLVALSITRDPGAFATVTLFGRLPWLVVALPAGALNDRLDRRRTMLRVNLARVGLIGALALVVAGANQELWMLYVVAFALGVGETFYDTAAQSIVPTLVGDSAPLERVNSRLYAVELTANQFVGPALGGLVAGLALTAGLSASAAAYLLAAIVLTSIAGNFRPAPPAVPARLRTDIAEGVRYLAHHQLLRALAICVGVSNLASTATFAVFPLYAIAPGAMGLDGAGFGLLLAAIAAGSVVGTFLVGPHGAAPRAAPSTARVDVRVSVLPAGAGTLRQRVDRRRRICRRRRDQHRLERHHGFAASADRPRPPARSGQRRIPPAGLGHHADRRRSRRSDRRPVRADGRLLDQRRARQPSVSRSSSARSPLPASPPRSPTVATGPSAAVVGVFRGEPCAAFANQEHRLIVEATHPSEDGAQIVQSGR